MKRLIPLFCLAIAACSKPANDPAAHHGIAGVPESCQQLLVVKGSETDILATLEGWEIIGGKWTKRITVPATVGKSGLATPEVKKEGDGKTPAGLYRLERAFGYAETIKTGLTYRQATATDLWVDDAAHADYNKWVTAPTKAKSFEDMKRKDDLYEIGAVIEYNTDPVVPGKGSAIFLHVWGGPDKPTAGCVAIEKSKLSDLLEALDRKKSPMIAIVIQPTGSSPAAR